MPSYAGFYITPEDWANWLRPHYPQWTRCPATAEWMIQGALHNKKASHFFTVFMVPSPESVPGNFAYSLMVYQMSSERQEYIKPWADSRFDLKGQQVLKRLIGLKASEWKTMWYDVYTPGVPQKAEFLSPTTPSMTLQAKANEKQKQTLLKKEEMDSHLEFEDGEAIKRE